MLLASTAGGLAGAVPSGALVLTERSGGSSFPAQAKPIIDRLRGGQ